MDVPCIDASKPEYYDINKGSMNSYDQVYIFMETNTSKGVGEHFYLPLHTWVSSPAAFVDGSFEAAAVAACIWSISGHHQG